ncbi:MAG: hypothetical protein COA79_10815 [Planctomycetota bacterium]|nr:MAG: hypothetical protein COA79_10815 [Planctomycetota bacterium]
MNWIDIFIFVYLLLLIFIGVARGFVYEVFGIIAVFGGIIFASIAGPSVGKILSTFISGENLSKFMGYIICFGMIYFTAQVLSVTFKSLLEKLHLQKLDRMFGGAVGGMKGICIICIVVMALISYPVKHLSTAVSESALCSMFITEENMNILKNEIAPKIKNILDQGKGLIKDQVDEHDSKSKKPEKDNKKSKGE